jgi:tRNA threonylcarbamoyladenosine biosynthesis protein TsaB
MLAQHAGPMQGTREEGMMPAIAAAMDEASVLPASVDRVVCGEGPGSFTSLRIAASLAKGFSHALNIPLYSVSSLMLVAAGSDVTARPVIAAINAMRGEFYVADFHVSCDAITETRAPRILEDGALRAYAVEQNALLRIAGIDGVNPTISSVGPFLDYVFDRGPVNLASWEPTYGRLAEAQVKWEKAAGRPLTT